jgi:hypothetical protein
MQMRPQRFFDMVARTSGSADIPLTSPGTKAKAVRHLALGQISFGGNILGSFGACCAAFSSCQQTVRRSSQMAT